jgi:hypothetical protein
MKVFLENCFTFLWQIIVMKLAMKQGARGNQLGYGVWEAEGWLLSEMLVYRTESNTVPHFAFTLISSSQHPLNLTYWVVDKYAFEL